MTTHPAGEPYVFLSYASADRLRALALADTLRAAGITVWLDRTSIAGGTSWGRSWGSLTAGLVVLLNST